MQFTNVDVQYYGDPLHYQIVHVLVNSGLRNWQTAMEVLRKDTEQRTNAIYLVLLYFI